MSFYSRWRWKIKDRVTLWWHRQLCKHNRHVWRLEKTLVGHHIGGRYYKYCRWCGKEDWDIKIDEEHQR